MHVEVVHDGLYQRLLEAAERGDATAAELLRGVVWARHDCDAGRLRCIGCGERVVTSRDALPVIAFGHGPQLMHAAICAHCSAHHTDLLGLATDSFLRSVAQPLAARSAATFHACSGHA